MSSGLLDLYRLLGPVDMRNIRRDPLLVWIGFLPFVIALAYRLLVPWLRQLLLREFSFDLGPYESLIASSFVTAAPGVIGMLAGFLLIDERDEGVLAAISVAPVSSSAFLAYRLSAPLLLGAIMTVVAYPIMDLAPMKAADLIVVAGVASLLAPGTALFLAVFAQNKVSGFAMVKILNAINIAPVAAWFIPTPWQWIAGFVPAYWPMKMVWLAAGGEPYAIYAAAGALIGVTWTAVLMRYFRRASHRSQA